MNRIIRDLEAANLRADMPKFGIGDTIRVSVKVDEGEGKFRTQAFEGTVIAKKGSAIREVFTVRRISFGEGVERSFPVQSPTVQRVEVVRRGKIRRAKLYYLRDKSGKQGRIQEEKRAESTSQSPVVAAH